MKRTNICFITNYISVLLIVPIERMSFSSAKDVFAKVTPVKESKTYVVNQRLFALKTRSENIQLIEGQKYPGQDIFWKRCFDQIKNRALWTRDLGLLDFAPRVNIDRRPLYNKQERNGSKFTRMYIVRYVEDDGTADDNIHEALVRLTKVLIKDSEIYFAENPHFKRKDVNAELSVPLDWNLTSAVGGQALEYYIDSDKVTEMMKSYWYLDFFKDHDQSEWASCHPNDIDNFFIRPFTLQALSFGCDDNTCSDSGIDTKKKENEGDDDDSDSRGDNDTDHQEGSNDDDKKICDSTCEDTDKSAKTGNSNSTLDIPESSTLDKHSSLFRSSKIDVSQYFDEEAKEIHQSSDEGSNSGDTEEEEEEFGSDNQHNEEDNRGNNSFLTPPKIRRSYRKNAHNVLDDTSSDEEKKLPPPRPKRSCTKLNRLAPHNLFPK